MERIPKTKKYQNMILKFADILEVPDFGMQKAAHELREWVTERREELPALSVKHCAFFPRHPVLHDNLPALPEAEGADVIAVPAAGLEPRMGLLTIVQRASRQRKKQQEAKTQAAEAEVAFKTDTVAFLMKEQGFDLTEASNIANVAWGKKRHADAKSRRPAPEAIQDVSEEALVTQIHNCWNLVIANIFKPQHEVPTAGLTGPASARSPWRWTWNNVGSISEPVCVRAPTWP